MAKYLRDSSPLVIFLLYIGAAFAVILGYQFFSPPQMVVIDILGNLKNSWRFINGIITFIELFPALAFSALVIPFGLKEHSEGGYAGAVFVGKKGFSSDFIKYLFWPVITAILSAITYCLLFFLVLPITVNMTGSILDRSELYAKAKLRAEEKAADREWGEAVQFIDICESLWPDSEEIAKLKMRLLDSLSAYRRSLAESKEDKGVEMPGMPGDPIYAADALKLAEEAYEEERYYDAHWLATLAVRLARPGAAEGGRAVTLASRAWDNIASLEPTAQEKEKYSLFRLKRDAYEAMNYGNWIAAFYGFEELAALTPDDPDVRKYLELSRTGLETVAFFIDELDLSLGTTLTDSVFSLPGAGGGRLVLRFSSLALLRDNAYAFGAEVLAAGEDGQLRYRVNADYGKLIPLSSSDGNSSTVLLFQALDRTDKTKSSGPVWTNDEEIEGAEIGANQILLPVSYDDLLLLSKAKQGTEVLNFRELFTAEKTFENFGFLKESFRSEIFRRLGNVFLFLPMSILALVLGWRYRARKKPRYVYLPMLILLPLVFSGAVLFYRSIIVNLSIWLSLNMGLTTALVSLGLGAFVLFIGSLVLLAAQHG